MDFSSATPAPISICTVKPFGNFDCAISCLAWVRLNCSPGEFGS